MPSTQSIRSRRDRNLAEEEDESTSVSWSDKTSFWLENFVSEKEFNKFKLLLCMASSGIAVNVALFMWANLDTENSSMSDVGTSIFLICQTVATGSFNSSFETVYSRCAYCSAILTGVTMLSVLIGFVNEQVLDTMQTFSEGKTKVACSKHTLILGWNESTVRVVCQLALLRRAYIMQNETWSRRMFPWTRVAPSSPLAAGQIVLLCMTKTKQEMDDILREALLERGISPKRTCIGRDVICRVGDPGEPQELLRMGAHRATAVLAMVTDEDYEEEEASDGHIINGISLKVLLSLKSVILSQGASIRPDFWKHFRCVLHLENHSPTITAALFQSPKGRQVVNPIDVRHYVNSLMFTAAVNPQLPDLMVSLLDFDGHAFRAKDAADLGLVGMAVHDCALIWEDAVFCGVVAKDTLLDPNYPDFNQGIACNPNRVITKKDRVIFIAANAFPNRWKPSVVDGPRFLGHVSKPGRRVMNILVCGWRPQWSDGARLAGRVLTLVNQISPGSNIVFLNLKNDFPDILDRTKDASGNLFFEKHDADHWEIKGTHVFFVHGDAGDADVLRAVMLNREKRWQRDLFDTAIVLGTSALPLQKKSQDLRMVSTFVLVHHIHDEVFGNAPLQVIGENQFDSTALITHAVESKASIRDMVNTQAVHARILVQALAYPVMQPAIAQMFTDAPGNPGLKMFKVGQAVVPVGSCTFADIARTVVEHSEMAGAVCIGVIKGTQKLIAPSPDAKIELKAGDLIACIERGEGGVMSMRSSGSVHPRRDWTVEPRARAEDMVSDEDSGISDAEVPTDSFWSPDSSSCTPSYQSMKRPSRAPRLDGVVSL